MKYIKGPGMKEKANMEYFKKMGEIEDTEELNQKGFSVPFNESR